MRRSQDGSADNRRIWVGRQARFLRALDLCHTAVMHEQLHHAETQALNFLTGDRYPVGNR